MTWWVVGGVLGWCATAPAVALATAGWFGRRNDGSVAVEDALTVPVEWQTDTVDSAGL